MISKISPALMRLHRKTSIVYHQDSGEGVTVYLNTSFKSCFAHAEGDNR